MKNTTTIFKLKSLSTYLKARPAAYNTICDYAKLYTLLDCKEHWVYVNADDVQKLLVPSLWREVSANCTQLIMPQTNLKRF
jgi:hypothetical protein